MSIHGVMLPTLSFEKKKKILCFLENCSGKNSSVKKILDFGHMVFKGSKSGKTYRWWFDERYNSNDVSDTVCFLEHFMLFQSVIYYIMILQNMSDEEYEEEVFGHFINSMTITIKPKGTSFTYSRKFHRHAPAA